MKTTVYESSNECPVSSAVRAILTMEAMIPKIAEDDKELALATFKMAGDKLCEIAQTLNEKYGIPWEKFRSDDDEDDEEEDDFDIDEVLDELKDLFREAGPDVRGLIRDLLDEEDD